MNYILYHRSKGLNLKAYLPTRFYKRIIWAGVTLALILSIGTLGYWLIGGKQYSYMDCLYMTIITISTIGFKEIIDLSGHTAGRIFTILIAFSGIGILTYILSNFTALVVEGELKETFKRKKMEKIIKSIKDHYIICGIGKVGHQVVNELHATKRPCIIVDINEKKVEEILETFPDQAFLKGDATDEKILLHAGIQKARGVFAATDDDNRNLVISLTAKHLNPNIRVVARCQEPRNIEKIKKAGADVVISPTLIGGLRMAAEMVRPTVTSFLDKMMRDKDRNLRVEEVSLTQRFVGKSISSLNLQKYSNTLLLAIKTKEDWIYNPTEDYIIKPENTLIVMTTPNERHELEKFLNSNKM